jgi:hypothetical protein
MVSNLPGFCWIRWRGWGFEMTILIWGKPTLRAIFSNFSLSE